MPGPPAHVHPDSEESFEVFEGTLDVVLAGNWSRLHAGETATAAAGVPRTPPKLHGRDRGGGDDHRPGRHIRSAPFEDMIRLIEEGKVKRLPKEPRSAIYAATLFASYPDWIRVAGAPGLALATVARIGEALRFTISYDRGDR